MSVISEVKDALLDAKKRYDKEKYIDVLEENLSKYEDEINRLQGQLNSYIDKDFVINNDHLELFEIFRTDHGNFYMEYLREYAKKSIDLEIALSELLNNSYFERPSVMAFGSVMRLSIPEDKKVILLLALKRSNEK